MRAEAVPATSADLLVAARTLRTRIDAMSIETERGRRLPLTLVEAFRDAGLFAMGIPASLGGREADVATMVATIEAVAEADGSAGWCVAIGATSGLVGAYLAHDDAREIFGANTIAGGVFAPKGTADATAGGYVLSGRWAFASGCQHCDWLMGGCLIDGVPHMLVFPREQAEIIDTWEVSGLRGTGSHDFAVREIFVPAGRCTSLIAGRPVSDGRLYLFPIFGLLALGIAAVALGIGRRAIDEVIELAGGKTPTLAQRTLAERSAVQADVARAEALVSSSRAFLYEAVGDAWDADVLTVDHRSRLRLAATNAVRACADAVDLCYDTGGGSSIYSSSPLQRCFRDVHAVTQHMMVSPATYELIGRIALGLPSDPSML